MAVKSIAAIPAEAIPFLGVAVLIADNGYELYAACETMRDLDELYLELGVGGEESGDAVHTVCNPELPDPKRSVEKLLLQGITSQLTDRR